MKTLEQIRDELAQIHSEDGHICAHSAFYSFKSGFDAGVAARDEEIKRLEKKLSLALNDLECAIRAAYHEAGLGIPEANDRIREHAKRHMNLSKVLDENGDR